MKIVLDRDELATAIVMYLTSRGFTAIGNPTLMVGYPTHNEFRVEVVVEKIAEPQIAEPQIAEPTTP